MGAAYKPSPIDPMIEKLVVQLGRLGKKAGKGFYEYPADGKKHLWSGLAELAPRAAEQPAVDRTQEALPLHPGAGDCALLRGERADRARGRRRRRHPRLGLRAVERRAAVADRHRGPQGVRGGMRRARQEVRPQFEVPKLLRDMAAKGQGFLLRSAEGYT